MDDKISKNIYKNKHRNIIWFNSPFCKLSNINIGKYFLGLINKHFKDDNPFRKIINKNNVKISYFCTHNISIIIDNQNKKLINKMDRINNDNLKHSCNCKIKNECPEGNKCNLDNILSLHGKCNLCLEKKERKKYLNRNLLNARIEMILACRHRNKFLV